MEYFAINNILRYLKYPICNLGYIKWIEALILFKIIPKLTLSYDMKMIIYPLIYEYKITYYNEIRYDFQIIN